MANPDTCLHNVVVQDEPRECHCVSCGIRITREIAEHKNYQFDDEHEVWVHDGQVSSNGDFQRRMDWRDKSLASETALRILRAKLTDGDLDGVFIHVDGTWKSVDDLLQDARVMRGGNWELATKADIIQVLMHGV